MGTNSMRVVMVSVLLLCLTAVLAVAQPSPVSPDEVMMPQTIRVGIDANWPPFDYYSETDGHQGIASDYLAFVAKALDLNIEYVPGQWFDVLEMARNGQVDMLACAAKTEQRAAYLNFTQPYIYIDSAVFVRKNGGTIQRLKDLAGKSVALPRGNFLHDYFSSHYPEISLVLTRSNEEALELVALGKVDAHVGNLAVGNYFLEKNIFTNVEVAFKVPELKNGFCFAVAKERPRLFQALERSLANIDDETRRQIQHKWVRYFSENTAPQMALTPPQRDWIRRHPVVRVGTGSDWPPYDFHQDDQYRGVARDYLDLISNKTGLVFDFSITDTWNGLQHQLARGSLDVLPAIYRDDSPQSSFLYTRPYVEATEYLFVRDDHHDIDVLEDIAQHTGVMVKGSTTTAQLEQRFAAIEIIEVDSIDEALETLADGDADFYIDTYSAVNFVADRHHLVGIRAAFPVNLVNTELSMAVSEQQPMLQEILQKALDDITPQQREQIAQRWFHSDNLHSQKIPLNAEEQAWINAHPRVTIGGDPERAPTSFYDAAGNYTGLIADYLQRISNLTGLQFVPRHYRDFSSALQAFSQRELDLVDATGFSPTRFRMMDFSSEHIRVDHVIVVRRNIKEFRRISDLSQQHVGVIRGSVVAEKLRKDVPDIVVETVDDAQSGLKKLAQGGLDAVIVDLPTFDYYSEKFGLSNLKVSGGTPYSYALYFGVHKDQPELRAILNKALASIGANERREMYRHWISFEYEAAIDYRLLWQSGAIFLVIIGGTLFWNRRLKAEVEQRRRAEAELLVARDAAEQATRAKSVFLAHMSHDIRTPLNSVIGFTDILDDLIADPVQKGYLRSIKVGGKALLGIINDILDLSKIEAGQLTLHRESVNPHNLFMEMEQLFHERLRQKNLEFIIDVDEELPPALLLDGVRLRQILLNLIGNAIKFTDHGYVALRVHKVFRDRQCSKLDLKIEVEDSGIGIAEENRQTIFQMFQQPKDQDYRRFGGTGLGLAICLNLVGMMDGDIHVTSVLNEGSTFTVTLHDVDVSVAVETEKETVLPEMVFEPAVLMVVDDVADNRELIRAAFADSAIEVVMAEHGEQALALIAEKAPDLILMDLRMPVLGGEETVRRLRENQGWSMIPVIALTASVLDTELSHLGEHGFNGYLRKPVEKKDLMQAVAHYLPHHSRPQPARDSQPAVCQFSSLAEKQQIVDALENRFYPESTQIRDQGDLTLFESFVARLETLNETCHIEILHTYCTQLRQALEGIDLKEVYGLLGDFPRLVAHVRDGEVVNHDQ
ncbi:MAG: hypothetical protein C0620_07060 [Desulfuromonas sp.]|nr:MAG: hypothetical protein C0620_07060 [Desulfuromonas sp.]